MGSATNKEFTILCILSLPINHHIIRAEKESLHIFMQIISAYIVTIPEIRYSPTHFGATFVCLYRSNWEPLPSTLYIHPPCYSLRLLLQKQQEITFLTPQHPHTPFVYSYRSSREPLPSPPTSTHPGKSLPLPPQEQQRTTSHTFQSHTPGYSPHFPQWKQQKSHFLHRLPLLMVLQYFPVVGDLVKIALLTISFW